MRTVSGKALSSESVGEDGPDPTIQEPADAIVRLTSTAICGWSCTCTTFSGRTEKRGDTHQIRADEHPRGRRLAGQRHEADDRVVIPLDLSRGHYWMCRHGWSAPRTSRTRCRSSRHRTATRSSKKQDSCTKVVLKP